MKRNFILIIVLVFAISIVGCSPTLGSEDETSGAGQELSIEDYYPFLENKYYEYEGYGNEFAKYQIYFEFIEDNRAQIKVFNSGTVVVKLLEYGKDNISEVYSEAEFYHIENMLNTNNEKEDILLKEPLQIGNTWSDPEGHKRSITGIDVEIETPFKKFKTIEVTTELGESKFYKNYYAENIGLVASIYEVDGGEVKTLLKSISEKSEELDILTFYPLISDIRTVSIKSKINLYTNQSVEKLLEDRFKNPPSEKLMPVISMGTVINSIHLDRGSWVLKVDFSKELITEMNAGSALETEILRSIVNTLGGFYDTDKVYITVEGKPYESGHYGLREGENFKVDLEDVEVFK